MRPSPRLAAIAVIATAFVALTIGVAGAHKFNSKNPLKFQAIVAVSQESAIFKGDVIANGSISQDPLNIGCIKRRLVRIIHRGVVIATGRTNKDGSWQIVGPLPPEGDLVIAKLVPEKLADSDKHQHRCLGDKASRTVE